MKSKKAKKQRPNVHTYYPFNDETCIALSCALLFMLNLNDFSFENEKIDKNSAFNAEEKWFDKEPDLTRGEVRATAKAIQVVLERSANGFDDYMYIDEEIPDLLADLKNSLTLLCELEPIFQQEVRTLRKIK